MEVCYWAILFMPLVILQYLYSLQIKGNSNKMIQFVPHRNHITSPLQNENGLKPIYMEECYWALLFMSLVILQYLYSLQIKGDSNKKIQFVPHRKHITSPLQNESGLKLIYMEVCYWALLFMPLVIGHYLLNVSVQLANKKGIQTKKKKFLLETESTPEPTCGWNG
jgi:hypothetical protein